jgi:hypothetical protein
LNRTEATWSAAYGAAEDTRANADEAPVTTAQPGDEIDTAAT